VEQFDSGPRRSVVTSGIGSLPVAEHPEVLDRDRHWRARGLTEWTRPAHARPTLVIQGTLGGELFEPMRLLGVRGRDHITLVVLGDGEQPVHVVDLLAAHPDSRPNARVQLPPHIDVTHFT